MPITRHRNAGVLHVGDVIGQEPRCRPRCAMVDGAGDIDVGCSETRETRPREVHVPVAGTTRTVRFDRRFVVKFSEQIRR